MLSRVKLSRLKGEIQRAGYGRLISVKKMRIAAEKRGNKARQQAIPLRRFIDQSAEAI
jgi:hypothetical protein